jgi:tetratricopeptide (TPR) repeat protein
VQGYTRRQLKEDKFIDTAQGAAEWTAEHRTQVIASAVVLIIVVGGTLGFISWRSHQNDAANLALGSAMRVFNATVRTAGAPAGTETESYASIAERGKAAEKELKNVADKYPHTDAGHIARYLEGVAAMQAGENSVAEKQLKAAADSGDKNVAALAKMALANYYRANNRTADATRIYKDLSDHPTETVSKSAAQLAMADMYESTDPQQAASIYQQIQKEDPNSPAAQAATSKLTGNKGPGSSPLPE